MVMDASPLFSELDVAGVGAYAGTRPSPLEQYVQYSVGNEPSLLRLTLPTRASAERTFPVQVSVEATALLRPRLGV